MVREHIANPVFEDMCEQLLALQPQNSRIYAIADMGAQMRRRWSALSEVISAKNLERLLAHQRALTRKREMSVSLLTDALIHSVIGRLTASFALTGRVWDPALENLWVRTDLEGIIDWTGVVDPLLRGVSTDAMSEENGMSIFPSDEAIGEWVAHRALRTFVPLFNSWSEVSGVPVPQLWAAVGEMIVNTSAFIASLPGGKAQLAHHRGQCLLDGFSRADLPVRTRRQRAPW